MPLGYTWSRTGQPFKVPKHWGAAGRINIIGSLACCDEQHQLSYHVLEERCYAEHVRRYLEHLASEAQRLAKRIVVVLDNAGFHRAKSISNQQDDWQTKGLELWFQPPYSPQFNLIETIWRKVKAFLLPRRCYDSREQLQEAVIAAFDLLGASRISHL